MQNIDPLYFIFPITVIAFSAGLVLYWHYKKTFTRWILLYSLVAYAGAIIVKFAVQLPTIGPFKAAVGGNPIAMGFYYGIQTAIFEVGGAYVVARYAASKNHLGVKDGEGYGLGLAFWENAGLIGALTLINYISYYAILSSGTNSPSQLVYNALLKTSPGLFYPAAQALPNIALAILERVSSLLAHFSWGYLVVLAVVYRRRNYLAMAIPMGLIDFFVPFSGILGTKVFESLIFLISLAFLGMTLTVRRRVKSEAGAGKIESVGPATPSPSSPRLYKSIAYLNLRRAISYGKIYLIIGILMSILISSLLVIAAGNTRGHASLAVSSVSVSILPLFALIGSLGALMVFVSDKDRGVYEYMIAYGVEISRIFWSIVLTTIGLVAIILFFAVTSMLTVMIATGITVTSIFVELLLFYSIPMSFATTMLGSMVGMIWSSLATRRVGINSPVGVAPYVGIAPILVIIILSSRIPSGYFIPVVGIVSIVLVAFVGIMIGISTKKMVRERFLSSA